MVDENVTAPNTSDDPWTSPAMLTMVAAKFKRDAEDMARRCHETTEYIRKYRQDLKSLPPFYSKHATKLVATLEERRKILWKESKRNTVSYETMRARILELDPNADVDQQ